MSTTQTRPKILHTDPERVSRTREVVVRNVLASHAVRLCVGAFNTRPLTPEQKKDRFDAAVAHGAAARKVECVDNPYEAAIYGTVEHLTAYINAQSILSRLGEKLRLTPQEARLAREMRDNHILPFNDALRELIYCASETNPAKLSFTELVQLLATTYLDLTQQRSMLSAPVQHPCYKMIRQTVIGMRNEVAFEDILSHTGLDWRCGEDTNGADYWINGAKFDIKASVSAAQKSQAKAIERGHNPLSIYDPGIQFEAFDNQLRLPEDTARKIARAKEGELGSLAEAIKTNNR